MKILGDSAPTSESRLTTLFESCGVFSWRASDDCGEPIMAPLPHDCLVILPSPVAMSVVLGHCQQTLRRFSAGARILNGKVM